MIDRDKKSKYGVAEVNGVQGLVLLPDDWVLPEGVTFNIGVAIGMDSKYYKTKNLLSLEEWTKMEAAGAVFLPAAGYRIETDILFDGDDGYYLSSTAKNTDEMCLMVFNSGRIRHDIVSSNDAGYWKRICHSHGTGIVCISKKEAVPCALFPISTPTVTPCPAVWKPARA